MSKFISHKPGKAINGDGSESDVTIFETEDGQLESVVVGSPIEKLLLDEMGEVSVEVPTPPAQPVETQKLLTDGSEKNVVSPTDTDQVTAPINDTTPSEANSQEVIN